MARNADERSPGADPAPGSEIIGSLLRIGAPLPADLYLAGFADGIDELKAVQQGEAAQVAWIKPLGIMLGLGLPALALLTFAAFGAGWAKAYRWTVDPWAALPWLRLGALVLGAALLVYAAPARIHKSCVPPSPSDPPLDPEAWKRRAPQAAGGDGPDRPRR